MAISWHSSIFLSLLSNSENSSYLLLEILRSLLLERSIIVVSSMGNFTKDICLASSIVNTLRLLVYPLSWV
jgi:hypothetical protein